MNENASEQAPKGSVHQQRSFLYDTLQVLSGRGAHIGFGMAAGIATSRIWGAGAVGMIALAMWMPDLITRILFLGTNKAIPIAIGKKLAGLDEIIGTLFSIWMIGSVLGVAIALLYIFSPANAADVPVGWAVLAAATIPLASVTSYTRGIAVGTRRLDFEMRLFWLRDPLVLIVVLIGGLALGRSDPDDGWIRILGLAVSYAAGILICLHLLRQFARVRPRWDKGVAKFIVQMSIKFGMGLWVMAVNYRIGVLLLGLPLFSIGNDEIGNYARAVSIAILLWQVPGTLGLVLFSRAVTGDDPAAAAQRAALVARVSTIIAIPAAIVLFVIAPYIVPLVYGSDFAEAGQIARILVPGVLVFFAARTFEADLSARGRPILVLFTMLPVTVANVVLSLLLIDHFGARGVAWSNTAAYTLGTVVITLAFSRTVGMPVREIVRVRRSDFAFVEKRIAAVIKHRRQGPTPDDQGDDSATPH